VSFVFCVNLILQTELKKHLPDSNLRYRFISGLLRLLRSSQPTNDEVRQHFEMHPNSPTNLLFSSFLINFASAKLEVFIL